MAMVMATRKIERVMSGVFSVLGVLQMLFGAVAHTSSKNGGKGVNSRFGPDNEPRMEHESTRRPTPLRTSSICIPVLPSVAFCYPQCVATWNLEFS